MVLRTVADTIGTRLARVARRVPAKTAIIEGDRRVTFQELDDAASAIAARLSAAASGPGRVCLYFERKIGAIASMFGAARIGYPYVVLDAGDPLDRTRFIVGDCEPCALLTEHALLDRARAIACDRCPVIDIDEARDAHGFAAPDVAPDSSVYLWYTSGSTGKPKGVVQTHRNLLFFADSYARSLRIGDADRHSLLYTLSFNASAPDIFGGMLSGGATLCTYDIRGGGLPWLAGWLDRERVTVLHCVPTVFREVFDRLAEGRVLPHLRAVDLGGEAVFRTDVELFRRHTLANCILVNQLASTEAQVIAQHVVTHATPLADSAVVPVGRCLDGVRVEIRMENGRRARTGETGEMIVCSEHISRGYWRRPELEAAAFSCDVRDPAIRRFRSGDLGRIDADGNLHFLGRNGSRVKVRGQSVELTEVEGALSACDGVARAAVLTRTDAATDTCRLVAFVAMHAGANGDASAIRRELVTRVPAYMSPADFVFLDQLPLTATGKIDRGALSSMKSSAETRTGTIVPPGDAVEAEVAGIVAALLGAAEVGRDDDFFLLGGDSLRGVELQLRVRDAFGVHLGSLHDGATIARIAQVIREATAPAAAACELPVLFPLWRHGGATPLFLLHGRHGQAFVSPHFMHLIGDDQPVWAFQARGLDGVHAPHATVEDMAADYLAALRSVRPHGPYFLGSVCAGAYVASIIARALRDAGESVLPLLLLDPPDRLDDGGYLRISAERFAAKMKARRAAGGSTVAIENPASMKALLRVATAFEHALARHRPAPYDGPVYMLASAQRASGDGLARVFTGEVRRYEVGTTHRDALDPRNPMFAHHLLRCIEEIRAAAVMG
jgi:amino acid adenylation domain-containing protein